MQTTAKAKNRTNISEPDQLDRAIAGDHAAFEAIMREHNRLLYRFVRNMTASDAEAEDIVQETYVRAFTALHGFNRRSRLSTWLIRIAMNETRTRRRKLRMTEQLDTAENIISMAAHGGHGNPMVPRQSTPEQLAARDQIRRYLETAIAALPEPLRCVFVLRGVEEFSTDETAEILGIRPETVKTRYHRSKERLRSVLDKDVKSALQGTHPFAGKRCDSIVAKVLDRLERPMA